MLGRDNLNFLAVLDASPDAVVVANRDGRILYANAQNERITGHTPEELEGELLTMLSPEWMRIVFMSAHAEVLAHQKPALLGVEQPAYGRHKDGREVPVELALNTLVADGEPLMVVTVRPAALRALPGAEALRHLEKRLSAAYSHLQLFIEHTPASVAMFDRDMRYLFASRRWLAGSGLEGRNVIGLSHYDLAPQTPEHMRQAHRQCLEGQPIICEEDLRIDRQGREAWARWECQPWRTVNGDVGGLIVFSEDITEHVIAREALTRSHGELEERVAERTRELNAAKEEATRANTLKSRFLAAASHDLRQPLQAAATYLSVLSRKVDKPEQKLICAKTERALDVAADVLSALLDVSRLESGAVQPQFRVVSAFDILSRAAQLCEGAAAEKSLRLIVHPSNCQIKSDPALLERVVANFLANAIRYTLAGEVEISCTRQGPVARIAVRDTGIGIPAQALGSIFDEYTQVGNESHNPEQGYGLGLSIAKQVAGLLNCPIGVDSVLDQGSTFWIDVPISGVAAAPLPVAVEPAEREAVARPKVLLVEDDSAVLDAMNLLLQDVGVETQTARSGAEARAVLARGFSPDLLVSDYRLPDCTGYDVLKEVRASMGGATPAIVLTGDVVLQTRPDESRCTIMHKPVDVAAFLDVLHNYVAPRRGDAGAA